MRPTSVFVGLTAVVALCAAESASAGPAEGVDRARLKKTLRSPNVMIKFHYNLPLDGDDELGATAPPTDIAGLRAQLKGDDDDADRWSAIANAYRVLGDAPHETDSRQKAVAFWRRRADAHPDDGGQWAGLGFELDAAGDQKGADEAMARATSAKRDAWKGWVASGDVLMLRALGGVAGRRFGDFSEMYGWFQSGQWTAAAAAASKDTVSAAEKCVLAAWDSYDKAVALAPDEIAIRWRRFLFRGLRAFEPGGGPNDEGDFADFRKIVALKPSDPRAIVSGVMFEAGLAMRGDPGAADRKFEEMPDSVHVLVADVLARLAKLAAGDDRGLRARAFEGEAVVHFLLRHDAISAEAAVRKALALSPDLRASWTLLAGLLKQGKRWDDLGKTCRAWIVVGDSAAKRDLLAMALDALGDATGAEKEWRAALALDQADYDANAGLACAVLRRAEKPADLTQARGFLDAAGAAWRASPKPEPQWESDLRVSHAVHLALSGDVDDAATVARQMLANDPADAAAKEILAAIGR